MMLKTEPEGSSHESGNASKTSIKGDEVRVLASGGNGDADGGTESVLQKEYPHHD